MEQFFHVVYYSLYYSVLFKESNSNKICYRIMQTMKSGLASSMSTIPGPGRDEFGVILKTINDELQIISGISFFSSVYICYK